MSFDRCGYYKHSFLLKGNICNNGTHIDYGFVLCDKVERTIRINRIVKKKAGLVRLLNLICSSSPIVRD